jgi:cell wall-associated NlpC family hydrolase
MTDRNAAKRTLSRWIVALALGPLLLSVSLPGFFTLRTRLESPSTISPSAAPTPAETDGRDGFLPLDGSEDRDVILGSRGGGYLMLGPRPSPAVPTVEAMPSAATTPVADPELGARLFDELLLAVFPAEQLEALPDYFVPDDGVFYVTSDTLNLRAGPGTEFEILHKLTFAEKVTRSAIGTGWSIVSDASGLSGYVSTKYLSTKKPAPKVSAADLLRAKVVAYAKEQLGVPYIHYAASPSAGFDCSGLTWYVYKKVGIAAPRSSVGYGTFGRHVKLSEIKPGDILCWDTFHDGVTRINHVSMYVGNGIMIHAPGTGKYVSYHKVSTYGEVLVDIRRIIT